MPLLPGQSVVALAVAAAEEKVELLVPALDLRRCSENLRVEHRTRNVCPFPAAIQVLAALPPFQGAPGRLEDHRRRVRNCCGKTCSQFPDSQCVEGNVKAGESGL